MSSVADGCGLIVTYMRFAEVLVIAGIVIGNLIGGGMFFLYWGANVTGDDSMLGTGPLGLKLLAAGTASLVLGLWLQTRNK